MFNPTVENLFQINLCTRKQYISFVAALMKSRRIEIMHSLCKTREKRKTNKNPFHLNNSKFVRLAFFSRVVDRDLLQEMTLDPYPCLKKLPDPELADRIWIRGSPRGLSSPRTGSVNNQRNQSSSSAFFITKKLRKIKYSIFHTSSRLVI